MSDCRLQARLHFSLVFVAALGFTDAVLSLPVQDLLELLLLPANTETNITSETFHIYVTARKTTLDSTLCCSLQLSAGRHSD